MQEWFKYVLNCDIKAWECSCLPRKFIHKEHVKLLLETDLLKLRKNFDNSLDPYIIKVVSDLNLGKFEEAKLTLFSLLKSLIFTNQIIENHKIVNYSSVKDAYDKFNYCDNNFDSIMGLYLELSQPEHELLKKKTDEILIKDKLSNYEKV